MSLIQPKISIITINYNNAVGLKETIPSIVGQTYKNIEYIVVDGASTDGSEEIIREFKNHITVAIIEPDKGIYNAMNKGIKNATGDYLLFINSGDILFQADTIEKAIEQGLDSDLVCGNILYDNNGIKKDWISVEKLDFAQFYHDGIPHPSTFIKRTLFDVVGYYDETLKIVSDWKFAFLAYCKFNCSYKHIDVLVSEFKEGGISSDPLTRPMMIKEREDVVKENFSSFVHYYEELLDARRRLRKLRYTIKIKKFLGIR